MSKIRHEQFGFRPKHNTIFQLLNVIYGLIINCNKKTNTAAILLDVEKAFDKVWHDGCIHKLTQFVIPSQLINIIISFLSDHTLQIKKDSISSSIRHIQAG